MVQPWVGLLVNESMKHLQQRWIVILATCATMEVIITPNILIVTFSK